MTERVGVVTYGRSGNLLNVTKALERAGARVSIAATPADFDEADRLVLPGVGSFRDAMDALGPGAGALRRELLKKPSLGICLGMQILASVGFEFGETKGLGLIDAEVKMVEVKCKVPHLGWGRLEILRSSPLLEGIGPEDHFYFMHSYEMVNYKDVVALTEYCSHKYVSVVQKDRIFGVQFHPEKSRDAGIRVLENFLAV
jgi:imidazole glycerol phosphate synthase glutamine amidotransferase subunit